MKYVFLLISFFSFSTFFAQNVENSSCFTDKNGYLVVDLSSVSSTNINLKPGEKIQVKLVNAMPAANYKITYKSEDYTIAENGIPGSEIMEVLSSYVGGVMRSDRGLHEAADLAIVNFMTDIRNEQVDLEYQLLSAKTEKEIQNMVKIINIGKADKISKKKLHKSVKTKSLYDDVDLLLNYYDDMVAQTVKTFNDQSLEIAGNKKYEIIITRPDEKNPFTYDTLYIDNAYFDDVEGDASLPASGKSRVYKIVKKPNLKTWKITVTPQQPGFFSMTYGVSFASPVLVQSEIFNCTLHPDGGFSVVKENNDRWTDLVFLPSVYVSYMRNNHKSVYGFSAFNPSLGLSIKSELPAVFMGFNFSFKQLVNVHVGVTAYQGFKLKNKYSPGEIVPAYLDREQLHDKTFLFNPCISFSFRFNSFTPPKPEPYVPPADNNSNNNTNNSSNNNNTGNSDGFDNWDEYDW